MFTIDQITAALTRIGMDAPAFPILPTAELLSDIQYNFAATVPYENLDILNSYHGVSFCPDQAPNCYITRIHVNGYLKVGAYATAIEAAIAYNKAADLLKKAGINKNFQTNYIDRMSSAAYADLYYHLPISSRITKMVQNTGE